MARVLIVDDDKAFCAMLSEQVRRMGHDAGSAFTLEGGVRKCESREYDVVFLDVNLPDGHGLAALSRFQGGPGAPEIIIITGVGDADGAELAIKSGVWDYIEKSSSMGAVRLSLSRALQYREGKQSVPARVALHTEGIVGSSQGFRAAVDLLAQAAGSDASVLITGETGTGKELFARAIHENSARAEGRFVVVDCTALPETLVESVLLGHERGAFTGADRCSEGLIKQADGGTLFLDEIGDLAGPIQKVFLRVLQERRFRPVGGEREVTSDFRLVVATNRDLGELVECGTFRQDLLFRLRSVTIEIPPLRERLEDIKALTLYHTARLCERYGIETKGFSPEFFGALMKHAWPGNVRELVNALEGALTLSLNEPTLYPKHLPAALRVGLARASFAGEGAAAETQMEGDEQLPQFRDYRKRAEKEYLQELLAAVGNDVGAACEKSGLSRSRLYDLLKEHGLSAR